MNIYISSAFPTFFLKNEFYVKIIEFPFFFKLKKHPLYSKLSFSYKLEIYVLKFLKIILMFTKILSECLLAIQFKCINVFKEEILLYIICTFKKNK